MKRSLQLLDLALQEFDLTEVATNLQPHELGEVDHAVDVHLLQPAGDGVQRTDADKARAEDASTREDLVGNTRGPQEEG
jgi:hypothetical protein